MISGGGEAEEERERERERDREREREREREGVRGGRCQAAEARTARFIKCLSFLSSPSRVQHPLRCVLVSLAVSFLPDASSNPSPSFDLSRPVAEGKRQPHVFDGSLRRAAERSNEGSSIEGR